MTNKCAYRPYAKFEHWHTSRYGVWIEFNSYQPLDASYHSGITISFGKITLFNGVKKICR